MVYFPWCDPCDSRSDFANIPWIATSKVDLYVIRVCLERTRHAIEIQ